MNEGSQYFLDRLFRPGEIELFGPADVVLAMSVSSLLVFVLASVYRYTHRGTSYSQSFIITLFLMAVSTKVSPLQVPPISGACGKI